MKKMNLRALKVKSFVTIEADQQLNQAKGGTVASFTDCNCSAIDACPTGYCAFTLDC